MPKLTCGCVLATPITKCRIAARLWAEYRRRYEVATQASPEWAAQTAAWQAANAALKEYMQHFKQEA